MVARFSRTIALCGGSPTESTHFAASLSPAATAATADAPPALVYGESVAGWLVLFADFLSFFAMNAAISASVGLRPSFFFSFFVAFFVDMGAGSTASLPTSSPVFRRLDGCSALSALPRLRLEASFATGAAGDNA